MNSSSLIKQWSVQLIIKMWRLKKKKSDAMLFSIINIRFVDFTLNVQQMTSWLSPWVNVVKETIVNAALHTTTLGGQKQSHGIILENDWDLFCILSYCRFCDRCCCYHKIQCHQRRRETQKTLKWLRDTQKRQNHTTCPPMDTCEGKGHRQGQWLHYKKRCVILEHTRYTM